MFYIRSSELYDSRNDYLNDLKKMANVYSFWIR